MSKQLTEQKSLKKATENPNQVIQVQNSNSGTMLLLYVEKIFVVIPKIQNRIPHGILDLKSDLNDSINWEPKIYD